MTTTTTQGSTRAKPGPKVVNPDDICAIIKACKEAKVVRFRYKDFEIEFEKESIPQQMVVNSDQKQTRQAIIQEAVDSSDDEVDQMMILDPGRYERLVLEKEVDTN